MEVCVYLICNCKLTSQCLLYTLTGPHTASWCPGGGNITAPRCLLSLCLCLSAGEYQVTISDNEEMRRLREALTRTWSWARIARKRNLAGFGASCAGTALLLNCKWIWNNIFLVLSLHILVSQLPLSETSFGRFFTDRNLYKCCFSLI